MSEPFTLEPCFFSLTPFARLHALCSMRESFPELNQEQIEYVVEKISEYYKKA